MATTKQRLNITLSKEVEEILKALAKRDEVPMSKKALQLLETAIELEEDELIYKMIKERDTKDAKYISHEKMWNKIRGARN